MHPTIRRKNLRVADVTRFEKRESEVIAVNELTGNSSFTPSGKNVAVDDFNASYTTKSIVNDSVIPTGDNVDSSIRIAADVTSSEKRESEVTAVNVLTGRFGAPGIKVRYMDFSCLSLMPELRTFQPSRGLKALKIVQFDGMVLLHRAKKSIYACRSSVSEDGCMKMETTLRKLSSASEFIRSAAPLDILGSVASIMFDDPESLPIKDHTNN